MGHLFSLCNFAMFTTKGTEAVYAKSPGHLLQYNLVSPADILFQITDDNLSIRALATIIVGLLIFLLIMQAIYNRRLKKSKGHFKMEKERYEKLFELTCDVIWEYSIKDDVFTKTDPDLGIRTGLATTPNFGEYMRSHNIVLEEDLPVFEAFYSDMRNGVKQISYEFRAKTLAGNYEWFELNGATIYNSNNEPVLVVGQTNNVHTRKQLINDLTESIQNDELTKVYNRITLEKKINDSLSEHDLSGICGLFLLDIDHFNEINSKYGDVFGDTLLLEIATKLKSNYENTDALIGRIGGDEFVIYIPSLSSKLHAEKEALCILTIINDILVKQVDNNNVSASIGISLCPPVTATFDDLLAHSDTALYYSKHKAPNSYMFYDANSMPAAGYKEQQVTSCVTAFRKKKYHYSLIDSTITTQVVDILSDAKEMESSINIILGVLGTFYNLDYIGILEVNDQKNKGQISHEWRSSANASWNSNRIVYEPDISRFSAYNAQNHSYLATDDIKTIRPISESIYQTLADYNVTGFIECNFSELDSEKNYITFCYKTPNRLWEPHEIDTLLLLAKILGGYLSTIQTKKQAEWIQRTDPLTKCNNLTTFKQEALDLICRNPNNHYITFYSDIAKFKLINENYGYDIGDEILIEFANALSSIVGPDETFGRIEADKFVGILLFDDLNQFLEKMAAVSRHMNNISSSGQSTYRIPIITGLCPVDSYQNMAVNIDRANMARKSIRNRHKSNYAFFSEIMKEKLMYQHEIEDQMELSLQNKDFKVYYQPKFNLKTNTISGAEALIRWQHPTKGLIFPDNFIPIFEENQFILKLDYYVFEQVCRHIRKLMDLGKEAHPVSINFSRLHLNDNCILEKLQAIIDKYNVPPSLLEIELTETALQGDYSNMYTILLKLHKMGFKISMDDFGSGLSSLNLLRTLPCDVIKLDKEFFQHGTSTERERIVITMIVKMAQQLHMTIVSEGVETEEQAEFLRSIQCDFAQGYLFAKPMPEADYERLYYDI